MVHTGQVAQYHWFESVNFDIHEMLKVCPEAVVGKYVVISGFRVSPEELAKGWEQHGDFVVAPRITSVAELPYDEYDEWHVFSDWVKPEISDVFVNYSLTLRSPQLLIDEAVAAMGSQTDMIGARYYAGAVGERQLLFWHEINRWNPESYISDGCHFTFVSRNPELFKKLLNAASLQ